MLTVVQVVLLLGSRSGANSVVNGLFFFYMS